jgi:hypothetical protein
MMLRFPGGRVFPAQFGFRRHIAAYGLSTLVLVALEFLTVGNWWLFWPMLLWGVVLAIHYFIVGALDADDKWATDRVLDLQTSSYDFDHIGSIEKRISEGDPSVTPHTERDR